MSVKITGFDMDKLEKEIKKKALSQVNKNGFDADCPNCHTSFKAFIGENICPSCSQKINFKPDSSWN